MSPPEDPLERLLAALPAPVGRAAAWILAPGRAWARIPAGVLLLAGGVLAFLPILGLWMLPLGLILLSEDVPFLRAPTRRGLAAMWRVVDRLRARLERMKQARARRPGALDRRVEVPGRADRDRE